MEAFKREIQSNVVFKLCDNHAGSYLCRKQQDPVCHFCRQKDGREVFKNVIYSFATNHCAYTSTLSAYFPVCPAEGGEFATIYFICNVCEVTANNLIWGDYVLRRYTSDQLDLYLQVTALSNMALQYLYFAVMKCPLCRYI